jgi:hypothetical protein
MGWAFSISDAGIAWIGFSLPLIRGDLEHWENLAGR